MVFQNGPSSFDTQAAEMERVYNVVRPTSISSMGQLLLQGYAMLAESCEDCAVPLMRKPHSDEALCVNCGKVINIIDSINVVDDAVAEGPSRAPTEVEQSTSNVEDPSQALADKMLEGWTLLAEHCPRCATPLVRSRQGRMLCVSCQMDVVAQPRGPGDGCRRPQETEDNAVQEQVIDSQIAQPGEDGLMEGDVRQDGGLPGAVMTTEEAILVRMSSTAQGLHGASAVDAAQKLEEISRCIQVLQELKNLALRP